MLMFTKYHAMDNLRNMLQVNSRHTELLTFHHLKPRTDGYKFSKIVCFPKMFSELTAEIRNAVILEGYRSFRFKLRNGLLHSQFVFFVYNFVIQVFIL